MSAEKPVVMCACTSLSFRELGASGCKNLEEIQERFGCSTHCGLCRPYVLKMLETGETEFAVISVDEPSHSEP